MSIELEEWIDSLVQNPNVDYGRGSGYSCGYGSGGISGCGYGSGNGHGYGYGHGSCLYDHGSSVLRDEQDYGCGLAEGSAAYGWMGGAV